GKPFPSYAKLLPHRGVLQGDSRYSWTVDFAARRAEARAKMQPLLDQSAAIRNEVVDLKERLKRLKKDDAPESVITAIEARIREQDKVARDLEAEAAGI